MLPNNTQTSIAKNSELLLKSKDKKSDVKLKLGKLWSKTNKKPVTLKINAPNAVASIRGTEWVVEVNQNGETSLAVMEGEIALHQIMGIIKVLNQVLLQLLINQEKSQLSNLVNPKEYLQFVYSYRIEPLAYLPKSILSNKDNAHVLRRLGAGSENIDNSNDLSIANSLKNGKLPKNHDNIPSDVHKLIQFSNDNDVGKIISYKADDNWSDDWKEWLKLLKIECLLALGENEKANSALNDLEISFETNFIKLKQFVSLGLLDEARKLSEETLRLNTKSAHLALSAGEIEEAAGNLDLAYIHYKSSHILAKHWVMPITKTSFGINDKWYV